MFRTDVEVLDICQVFPSNSDGSFFEKDFILNRETMETYTSVGVFGRCIRTSYNNLLNHFSTFPRSKKCVQ